MSVVAPEAYGQTLETLGRALDREAHNLTRWPDLLWQQLHNRLQWEEGWVPGLHAPGRTGPGVVHG